MRHKMASLSFVTLSSILFTTSITATNCHMQTTYKETAEKEGVQSKGEFASIQDTWDAVGVKLKTLFFKNKSNCSDINQGAQTQNVDLTLPEQRTLMAVVALPSLGIFLMILTCCICCRLFFCKPEVPPYLTLHFPLYQNVAESRATTPTHEGQHCSLSLTHSYTFSAPNRSSTSHRCP